MSTEFDPEAEAADLVDHAAIARAEAALRDAEDRRDCMVKLAAEAERRAIEARNGWPRLIEATAAGGEVPTVLEVAALHDEGEHLGRYGDFLGAVARKMEQPVDEAREALADARHAAWSPVMRRGQDMRIAAASKLDRAKATGPRGMTAHEVAERDRLRALVLGDAEEVWRNGNALVELAIARGVRFRPAANFIPSWGVGNTSEASERAHFGRTWLEEELQHVAAE